MREVWIVGLPRAIFKQVFRCGVSMEGRVLAMETIFELEIVFPDPAETSALSLTY